MKSFAILFFSSTAALWLLLLLLLLKSICNPSGNFGSSLLVWSHACMHAYKRQTFSFVSLSRSSIQIIVNIKISICTIGTSLLFAKKSCLRRTLCCRRLHHNSYHCRQLAVIQTYSHICEIQCSCCWWCVSVSVCALFFFHSHFNFIFFVFVCWKHAALIFWWCKSWMVGWQPGQDSNVYCIWWYPFDMHESYHIICTVTSILLLK